MRSDGKKPPFREALFFVLLALLSACMVLIAWHLEPMLSRDGTFYANQITEKLQNGVSFYHADFHKPPLFQLLGCGICRLSGIPAESALLVINTFCLAMMVFPMAYLARRVLGSSVIAFFCAAWLVTSPDLFRMALGGTREPLFLCFLLYGVAAALRYGEKRSLRWVGISAFLGMLAALTRFEGLLGSGLCLIYMVCVADRSASWRRRIVSGEVYVVVAGVTFAGACLLSSEVALFSQRMIECFLSQGAKFL